MEKIKIGACVQAKENIGIMKKGDCGIVLDMNEEKNKFTVCKITIGNAKGKLQIIDNFKLDKDFDVFNISDYLSGEFFERFPELIGNINRKDLLDFFLDELNLFLKH